MSLEERRKIRGSSSGTCSSLVDPDTYGHRAMTNKYVGIIVCVLSLMLPNRVKITMLRICLGYDIHPKAWIGMSLIMCNHLYLGPGAHIGHFNVVRNVNRLVLQEGAGIGQWNWISAASEFIPHKSGDATGICVLEEKAILTSRHYVDCSGGFFLGSYSIIAGVRSTIMTHQIDVSLSEQSMGAVRIGDHCHIGSNVKILPFTNIAGRSMVAMGSVVRGAVAPSGYLWAGVPAVCKREVTGEWFERTVEASKLPTRRDDVS